METTVRVYMGGVLLGMKELDHYIAEYFSGKLEKQYGEKVERVLSVDYISRLLNRYINFQESFLMKFSDTQAQRLLERAIRRKICDRIVDTLEG